MTDETQTYENLPQLLDVMGAPHPGSLGRMWYKVTAAGVWTTFLIEKPNPIIRAEVRATGQGELRASVSPTYVENRVRRFLGLEKCEPVSRDLWDYLEKLDTFCSLPHQRSEFEVSFLPVFLSAGGEPFIEAIEVFLVRVKPEYEKVYYEDPRAREDGWWDRCCGVQIGSIVEGSNVEIGPETLLFPFTGEQLDQVMEDIEEQAEEAWIEANIDDGEEVPAELEAEASPWVKDGPWEGEDPEETDS